MCYFMFFILLHIIQSLVFEIFLVYSGILFYIYLYDFCCFGVHFCIVFLLKHAGGLPIFCYR